MVGHVSPEAVAGGPIAAIADGDIIVIDAEARRLDVQADLSGRRTDYTAPARPPARVLEKYAKSVASASEGAVTIPVGDQPR
jgi:dihydroxy-acid dehydratase